MTSMNNLRLIPVLAASACILAGTIATATAGTISVDFADPAQAAMLDDANIAGAPGYEASYWNVVTGKNTANADPNLPLTLQDDSGTLTSATLSTYNSVTDTSNAMPANPSGDNKVFGGYIEAYYTNGVNFTVENIPYALYDVVVYVMSNNTGREGGVTTSNTGATEYFYRTGGGGSQPGTYVQVTSTDPNSPTTGNYVVFENVSGSGSDLTVSLNLNNWSGAAGFQIVEVPEPATMAILAAGGMMMLLPRRRA